MRLTAQVNLPKMAEGEMDVSFMIVYVGQGPLTQGRIDNAYKQAIAKFDAIHRLTEQIAPSQVGLALTPEDVIALHKEGKRAVVIGIENGYPIGFDLKRVKEFYDGAAATCRWRITATANWQILIRAKRKAIYTTTGFRR